MGRGVRTSRQRWEIGLFSSFEKIAGFAFAVCERGVSRDLEEEPVWSLAHAHTKSWSQTHTSTSSHRTAPFHHGAINESEKQRQSQSQSPSPNELPTQLPASAGLRRARERERERARVPLRDESCVNRSCLPEDLFFVQGELRCCVARRCGLVAWRSALVSRFSALGLRLARSF